MKRSDSKRLVYAVVPTVALALFMGTSVSAHGWGWLKTQDTKELAQQQQEMFQHQADLLGTNVDTVKNAWAQGKTMPELAQELGVSETDLQAKLKEARQAELKQHLQTLVDQGVITQTQADQRYTFMEQHLDGAAPGKGMARMMRGGGWGRHGPGF